MAGDQRHGVAVSEPDYVRYSRLAASKSGLYLKMFGLRRWRERIAFRQINKATGNRLRQQLIDEETREPVAPEHKGRGYEVAKGHYLIVEDAELEAIEIQRGRSRPGLRLAKPMNGINAPQRPDCVAGHVGLELTNVGANYPFERSRKFPGIQPNSGNGDCSRFELRLQLGP